jgi:hypothetical protein
MPIAALELSESNLSEVQNHVDIAREKQSSKLEEWMPKI